MATKPTKPTTNPTAKPAPLPVPTASATSNGAGQGATLPTGPAVAAARTSTAQANLWHANTGSTMPPDNLVLAVASVAPKAGSGPRAQHQQALVYVLAQHPQGRATVAQCQAYAKANAAALGAQFGAAAAQCAAPGNVRCSIARGVVQGVAFA